MDNQNYDRNPDSGQDPWDKDFYETGSTRPPKSYRGAFALVLVVGIILGGLLSVMGGFNARIFQKWKQREQNDALPVSLYEGEQNTAGETTVPGSISGTGTGILNGAVVELQPSPDGVDTPTQEGGLSLQQIYEKSIHSTVSILCTLPGGTSTGSGVVLTQDGYILTNYHVVENAVSVQVLLTDGRQLAARAVGGDKLSDLAVLYVQAQDLVPAEFGDSDALRVGDKVVAIGDPLGIELRGTMTDGIISAINRDVTTGGRTMTLIQTNAALNSGNSGGPLINCYGQVIGINTMKIGDYVSSAGVEGLGFAIPSTTVKQIVDQLMVQGYVSGRPKLGITGTDVPGVYQYYHRMPAGVFVTDVEPGSDAQTKGLQVQDIILSIDDHRVESTADIETALYSHQAGDTVELLVYRAGRQYRVQVTLGQSK